jgi:uncharacterized protein (DUF58 family)
MTRAGLGFIVAGAVMYLLGAQAHIGWLYFFAAAIWSLVILSVFLPWWSLRSLHVDLQIWPMGSVNGIQEPVTPVEDDVVEARLTVSNQGRLPRWLIKVMETCPMYDPSTGNRIFLLSGIKAKNTVVCSHVVRCYRRGRYRSAGVTLETRVPLGLFVSRRSFDVPMNLTVYPSCILMDAVQGVSPDWTEQLQRTRSGEASEFYGSREHFPGEPLRRIHWRNSARLGRLVVKQYEEATGGPVGVAFDGRREWGQGRETTLEYSVKIAASIARSCADSQRTVSVLAGSTPQHRTNWVEAMDYLAELSVGDSLALKELASMAERGQPLVVIASSADEDAVKVLPDLASKYGGLVVVLLEGFTDQEVPQESLLRLQGSNVDLVRCSRGDLKSAMIALSRTRVTAGWNVQGVTQW